MSKSSKVVALVATLCLLLWGAPAQAAGKSRIGDVREGAAKVRVDGANGKDRYRTVSKATRVFVKSADGTKRRADVNQLVRGAKISGAKVDGRELTSVTLIANPATGNTDCSFDTDEDDGDDVGEDSSFDCSSDYDDDTLETEMDCSYDSSTDGPANDWSMDASWDCSYSETDDSDEEEGGLDWDCSFSASAGGYEDVDGGDNDADLDFDCSWNGADSDSALWDCSFIKVAMGFECVSVQLDQTFGYVFDTETMTLVGGMDFQEDIVADGDEGEGVGCDGSPSDGYDCSVDGEAGEGDCSADWDFDRSRGSREGDVSGSMSYSCSWDS